MRSDISSGVSFPAYAGIVDFVSTVMFLMWLLLDREQPLLLVDQLHGERVFVDTAPGDRLASPS